MENSSSVSGRLLEIMERCSAVNVHIFILLNKMGK